MRKETKLYLTAGDISELIGVSLGTGYRIVRKLNSELEQEGFIVIAGKIPRKFFDQRYFGGSCL